MVMRIRLAGGRSIGRCRGGFLLLVTCVSLGGCGKAAAPELPANTGAPAPIAAAPAGDADFTQFDRLVTPDSVFPDRAQRSLYRMLPPVTENGQRAYAFQLIPQAGMSEARHFDLVTITWARGGQLVTSPGATAGPSGIGGPGGGFVDAFAQTEDRAWDVRVTQGMLLPDGVDVPAFDVEKTAARMVRLYKAQSSPK